MSIPLLLVLKMAAIVLTVACSATVYLILSLHGNERKMRAAYFLNAGRLRLAWGTVLIAGIGLALDQFSLFSGVDEMLYAIIDAAVVLVLFAGAALLYLALSKYERRSAGAPAAGK